MAGAQGGLVFNEDKTRIVSLDEGFDFFGVHRPPTGPEARKPRRHQ